MRRPRHQALFGRHCEGSREQWPVTRLESHTRSRSAASTSTPFTSSSLRALFGCRTPLQRAVSKKRNGQPQPPAQHSARRMEGRRGMGHKDPPSAARVRLHCALRPVCVARRLYVCVPAVARGREPENSGRGDRHRPVLWRDCDISGFTDSHTSAPSNVHWSEGTASTKGTGCSPKCTVVRPMSEWWHGRTAAQELDDTDSAASPPKTAKVGADVPCACARWLSAYGLLLW
jgi:hypothetical protein